MSFRLQSPWLRSRCGLCCLQPGYRLCSSLGPNECQKRINEIAVPVEAPTPPTRPFRGRILPWQGSAATCCHQNPAPLNTNQRSLVNEMSGIWWCMEATIVSKVLLGVRAVPGAWCVRVAERGHDENRQEWEKPPETVGSGWGEGAARVSSLSSLNPLPAAPKQFVYCGTPKHIPLSPQILQPKAVFWDFVRMPMNVWVHCWGQNGRRWSCRR